jgi:hypothetical protein
VAPGIPPGNRLALRARLCEMILAHLNRHSDIAAVHHGAFAVHIVI